MCRDAARPATTCCSIQLQHALASAGACSGQSKTKPRTTCITSSPAVDNHNNMLAGICSEGSQEKRPMENSREESIRVNRRVDGRVKIKSCSPTWVTASASPSVSGNAEVSGRSYLLCAWKEGGRGKGMEGCCR